MNTIQIYDPPMCCSTGLCGNDIDPTLVSFAALLTQLSQKGVKVERFNLGQQPMAFVQNPTVKALLDDAASVLRRRCPEAEELFRSRGWRLPSSIDRVYVIDRARALLSYRPQYNFRSLFEADATAIQC